MTIESLDKLEALKAKATQGRVSVNRRYAAEIYIIPESDSGKGAGANFVSAEDHRKSYFAVMASYRHKPREWDGITQEQHEANIQLHADLFNSASDLFDLAREALRLRQLVEDASHDENCEYIFYLLRRDSNGRRLPDAACNCWKARFMSPSRDMAADKETS